MEGIYWIRIAAIVGLFLGSLYVLAPTALQDVEAESASQVATIDSPTTKADPLKVVFEPTGEPEATAAALSVRLDTLGIAVSTTRVEDGKVVVVMNAGTARADVVQAATAGASVNVYPVDSVVTVPSEPSEGEADTSKLEPAVVEALTTLEQDLGFWGGKLPELAQGSAQGVPDALSIDTMPAMAGGVYTMKLADPLEDDIPFTLVSVDGLFAALGVPGENRAELTLVPLAKALEDGSFVQPQEQLKKLALPPMPAPVAELKPDAAPAPTEKAEAAPAVESMAPEWLVGLLPMDLTMNLGLDLQGGVDLTLQVELDDAVLSQVNRDINQLRAQAEKDGIAIRGMRRDAVEPLIMVDTDVPLGDLQTFMRDRLGIDYVYSATDGTRHSFKMTDERIDAVQKQAVEQVLETLRKRVDATGVKEPTIVKKSGGQINVQLPGKVDFQAAIDAIGTTAVLEFRMVDEKFDDALLDQLLQAAQNSMPEEQYNDDELLNSWLWETKRLPEDRMVLWEYENTTEGEVRARAVPLINEVPLTGNDVNDARASFDQNNQPHVSLSFKPRGGQIFCDITTENVGNRFAIILDSHIMSTPNIKERICGGAASIDMGMSEDPLKEANTLALVLRTGSLDAPVSVGDARVVGATLGADAIRSGSIASAIGFGIVLVFMALWYRRSGLIANVALGLNVLLVLASLAVAGATLTLPGIAGIALTIGMAVDANIIIFERIREELRLGVLPRKAVEVGFDKAVIAVLDANITTFIAGIVLYSYGTGPIKGFAVTLMIGIITTLVTALFVTRTLMELVTRSSNARLTI